ncbi:hypothetical protein HO133_007964 [Letharia lupina]|uniref:Uncharacterized protein n=1 Tax=Letharia lupina TaxID=560253 RepID=A0A8H6CRM2_9LECA|nr:uncharacterized protein HO133_007964 [Letharia lupina]KAF6228234.1 hypothetical protein HO133_007964 [Letharia lupina]
MNTRDRFRAIKFPRPTDNLLTPQRQNFTQPEWVKTVNNIYNLEDSDSSDNVDNGDPAASVYEFSPVKLSGGNDFESLATVLQGCSLVSLDELFASAVIRYLDHEKINEHALEELKFWPVKSIFDCLEQKAPVLLVNQADRHRLRLLEAVDSTKYIIICRGEIPEKGRLVLLRVSDGHVHVASFMRSSVGLPLRQQDVRDDHH